MLALEDAFEDVQCDVEEHLISVTTEPVILDGIDLGRFQIRLDWEQLLQPQPYTVVALDPHPAESNRIGHPSARQRRNPL